MLATFTEIGNDGENRGRLAEEKIELFAEPLNASSPAVPLHCPPICVDMSVSFSTPLCLSVCLSAWLSVSLHGCLSLSLYFTAVLSRSPTFSVVIRVTRAPC